MKHQILVMLLICLALSACAAKVDPVEPTSENEPLAAGTPVKVEGGEFTRITSQQLAEILKDKDFLLVNTHIPYEGEIEETDALIPYDQTTQRLAEYPADKEAKIVVYCRSGRMSTIAAGELVKAGYTNVWELDGGMAAWEAAGYPLVHQE